MLGDFSFSLRLPFDSVCMFHCMITINMSSVVAVHRIAANLGIGYKCYVNALFKCN